MASIAEIRAKYPQYEDLSDEQLADAMHRKFYSDMPREQFNAKLGIGHSNVPAFDPGVEGYNAETGMVERDPRSKGASFAHGAADMVGLGFTDELASYAGSQLSGKPREQVLAEMRGLQQGAQADNPGSYLGGQLAGGVAQAAITGPASFSGQMASRGLGGAALGGLADGAIIGGTYGAGSGETTEDRAYGAGIGALTGGVMGGAAPYAVSGVSNLARRAVTPFSASPELQAAAQLLQREGVPLSAGQRTGSKGLRYAESELGGRKAENLMERQSEAFTDAALRRVGASGRASPENMSAIDARLSQGFKDISARNTLVADKDLGQDIGRTLNRYGKLLETQQKPIIDGLADDIIGRLTANGGKMTGVEYQAIRSDLSTAAKSATNQNLGGAFRGLRNALDDAMDRSIRPEDAGLWTQLRRQWGNKKILESASTGGGSDAALGLISPAQLRIAATTGNRGGYARGEGDFSELARAGQAAMTPLPNSGTAARTRVQNLGALAPMAIGSAGGAAYGAQQGGVEGLLGGAAAGAALPKVIGALLMSRPGQSMIGNQLLPGGEMSPQMAAIIAALMNRGMAPQAIEQMR